MHRESKGWKSGTPMKDMRGYLKKEEIRRIIEAGISKRDRLLMETLWQTGARVSEIVGLKAADNKKEKRLSRLEIGLKKKDIAEPGVLILRSLKKGAKHRYPEKRLIVTKALTKELSDCAKNIDENDRIFPITRQRVDQIVRRAGKLSGITQVGSKKLHVHHFRHSHAVAYIKANNDIEGLRRLQKRLGHASIEMTAHYLQFGAEGDAKEIEEIFG